MTSWEATSPPASSTSGANGLGVAWGSTTAGEGWVGERVAGGMDDGDDGDDDDDDDDEMMTMMTMMTMMAAQRPRARRLLVVGVQADGQKVQAV